MIEPKEFIENHKINPDGAYNHYSNYQIEQLIKDYTYEFVKEILKDLYQYNKPKAGGQDNCVGVREAYGKNLIEIVEEHKRKLEE